jgi:hypothetical protein
LLFTSLRYWEFTGVFGSAIQNFHGGLCWQIIGELEKFYPGFLKKMVIGF